MDLPPARGPLKAVVLKQQLKGKIEPQILDFVVDLNTHGYHSLVSCAGHGKIQGNVIFDRTKVRGEVWAPKEKYEVISIALRHGVSIMEFGKTEAGKAIWFVPRGVKKVWYGITPSGRDAFRSASLPAHTMRVLGDYTKYILSVDDLGEGTDFSRKELESILSHLKAKGYIKESPRTR
jgi:hypothetical protein